jgi:pimeloyl-ACP methyl ester carboxylesterase
MHHHQDAEGLRLAEGQIVSRVRATATVIAMCFAIAMPASAATAPEAGIRNVVIVPDAFVDGSGWRTVHDILKLKGYKVSIVQAPHTTLDDDIAVARKVIFQQTGPVVVVAGGIGGTIMSNVASGDKVKALVYVAALAPEIGETSGQLLASIPAAGNPVRADRAGFHFVDRASFNADFAADLSTNRTDFMAASQVPITNTALGTPSWAAAWHKKPSYAIVATEDRMVHPDLQRMMYKRAGAKVTELKASHAVYISRPEEVAKLIERATLAH